MLGYEPHVWAVFAVGAFLIGVTKTGIPGIGIVAVVLMASVMDVKASVGFVLPVLIMGDIFAVAYYRRHADWGRLARLMPAAFAGIVIGYILLDRIDSKTLAPMIGVIVIVLLALEYWWRKVAGETRVPSQWWVAACVGVAAGFVTMISNAAGPLIVIYFVAMRFDKVRFIGTTAWYFLVLNCVKVPFSIDQGMITHESFVAGLVLLPAVIAGAFAGIYVLKRISQKWFVAVAKLFAFAAAVKLLIP